MRASVNTPAPVKDNRMDIAETSSSAPANVEEFRERLAAIKCPRSIDFEAELPRHPTGKLYKRLLKDRYWAGHASKII